MPKQIVVTAMALSLFIIGMVFVANDAMAACAAGTSLVCWKNSNGGQTCMCAKTGSDDIDITVNGVGKICDSAGLNCTSQGVAAIAGTIPGSTQNCTETGVNFPTEGDGCGMQGIAFCVNPAGNAAKAQGQPFTLNAVLEGAAGVQTCQKNGKCTLPTISLEPTSDEVTCINPNWTAVGFTATKFKARVGYCTTTWAIGEDPATCVLPGVATTAILLCQIDPSKVTVSGGQGIPCTLNGLQP